MPADTGFYKALLDDLTDGVYFLDSERRITYWNRGAQRITGYTGEEVLGKRCAEHILVHSDCDGRILCSAETCPAVAAIKSGEKSCARIFLKHKQGHRIPVVTRVRPLFDEQGAVVGAAEVFNVSAEAIASEAQVEELKRAALIDPLTGVGNRRLGEREMEARLQEWIRYEWPFGVLFVDIDRFKRINDVNGHDVGDRMLRMVAQTLSHNVRSFDVVSRWGGEEFLLLLKNIRREHLLASARKLAALVRSASLTVGSFQLQATVSVGATLAQSNDSAETLMRRADQLMYRSKKAGGDQVAMDSVRQAGDVRRDESIRLVR